MIDAGFGVEAMDRTAARDETEGPMSLLIAFLGGLAGSLHCVGMCGVFPLALAGQGGPRAAAWARQLLYHAGRINTLAVIGALAGTAGAAFVTQGFGRAAERILAVGAGTFMIVVGLEQLGLLAQLTERGGAMVRDVVRRALSGVLYSRSRLAPLALGVFNAFLPCQLIYAFAAQAASTASILGGAATMVAFSLGTVPAMLALGVAPSLMSPRVRGLLARGGAVLVIAYGALTVARGLFPEAGHGSHHHHGDHAAMPTATRISAVSTSLMTESTALAMIQCVQPRARLRHSAQATAAGMAR